MYQYAGMKLEDKPGKDFDANLREIYEELASIDEFAVIKAAYMDDPDTSLSVFWYLWPFAEFLRIVPENDMLIEAILVKNGYVMIVRTVHSKDEIIEDPPLMDCACEGELE